MTNASSSGSPSPSSGLSAPSATSTFGSGALEALEAQLPAASTSQSSDSKLTSLVEKYGPVVLGLLAGNVLIGLLLCILGLMTCLRVVVKSGVKIRSISPSYAPVRAKEEGSGADEKYFD